MYVSAINPVGYSTRQQKSTSVKKSGNALSFTGYNEEFARAFASFPKTRTELNQLYYMLARAACMGKGVQNRKGSQIMSSGFDPIEQRIIKLGQQKLKQIVLNNGKERVTACEDLLRFNSEEAGKEKRFLEFELDAASNKLEFRQNDENITNIFDYYPNEGNLKSHKQVTGSGFSVHSEKTCYDPDGTENDWKTFFANLFCL